MEKYQENFYNVFLKPLTIIIKPPLFHQVTKKTFWDFLFNIPIKIYDL